MDGGGPCTVVVLGVTGDGKSTTCNTLVGIPDAFAVSGGLASETANNEHRDYLRIDGDEVGEIRVIDTIGLHDTDLPAAEVMSRFRAFADLVPMGIDCFVFVVRWGRFKPEHEAAFDAFAANCGEAALAHCVLCFTSCGLDAERLAEQLEANAPKALRKLLPKLGGHPIGIDNAASPAAARATLHGAVDAVIATNAGVRYTHEALSEARERHVNQREEERAAFASAVSDWRKGSGPVVIEYEQKRE